MGKKQNQGVNGSISSIKWHTYSHSYKKFNDNRYFWDKNAFESKEGTGNMHTFDIDRRTKPRKWSKYKQMNENKKINKISNHLKVCA